MKNSQIRSCSVLDFGIDCLRLPRAKCVSSEAYVIACIAQAHTNVELCGQAIEMTNTIQIGCIVQFLFVFSMRLNTESRLY